jgi:hypothetical protein
MSNQPRPIVPVGLIVVGIRDIMITALLRISVPLDLRMSKQSYQDIGFKTPNFLLSLVLECQC